MATEFGIFAKEIGGTYIILEIAGSRLEAYPWTLKCNNQTIAVFDSSYGYEFIYTVSGLSPNTTYTFTIYEYGGNYYFGNNTFTTNNSGSSCPDTGCSDTPCPYTPCSDTGCSDTPCPYTPCNYNPPVGIYINNITFNFGTGLTGITAVKWNQILDKILEIYKVFNPTTTLNSLGLTYAYGASTVPFGGTYYPMSANAYYKPTATNGTYTFYINDNAYIQYNRTIAYYLNGIPIASQSVISGAISSGKTIGGIVDGNIMNMKIIDNLTQQELMSQVVTIATYFTASYYNKVGSVINVLAQRVGSTRRIPVVSNQTSLISSSAIAVGNRYTDHFTGIITTLNDIISLVNDAFSS